MTKHLEERYILDAEFLNEDLTDVPVPLDAVLGRKTHISLFLRKRDINRHTAMEIHACRKKSLISVIIEVAEIPDRQARRIRICFRGFFLGSFPFRNFRS